MAAKLSFFPVGCGDMTLVQTEANEYILIDCHIRASADDPDNDDVPDVAQQLRDRLPRDDTLSRVLIALFANLGLFLVFSFTQVARSPAPASLWPRLFADLACSQILLALIAPWFFAIQARALALTDHEANRFA